MAEAKNEKKSKLNDTLEKLEKSYGKGTVLQLDSKVRSVYDVISTGSLAFDWKVLGVGGFVKGKMYELMGWEGCISEDTYIKFITVRPDGVVQDCKGSSIKKLYERFHNRNEKTEQSEFNVISINDQDRVFRNPIIDVVKSGIKECFEVVTEKGFKVKITKDHNFYTGSNYIPLEKLTVGSIVFVHNNTPYTKSVRRKRSKYKETTVKYYYRGKIKQINGCYYYRVKVCRLVFEAFQNNISYEEYKHLLNSTGIPENFWTIPEDYNVHHIDENSQNDDISNLQLICPIEHVKIHAIKRHNNLRFVVIPDKIVSITSVGTMETYDIKCPFPYNNYIANGIVVHNSGKSTLCGHAVAECQKKGGLALYVDSEHAVDVNYFKALGVDTSKMLISQPSCGEEGFNVATRMIQSGDVDLVILDSDSSLIPKVVIDGEIGDSAIGKKARLNSDAYPKLKNSLVMNNTCVIVVSQFREKIGVMFGCLHGDTLVNFTDGRSIPIRKVVKEKIKGEVYSVDEFGNVNKRKILDWHDNGIVSSKEDFIHIETTGLDGQNTIGITVTPYHTVLTSDCWKEAREIKLTDKLVSRYKSVINNTLKDFFYGIYVGDSSVLRRANSTANIRFQDKSNPDYLKWKIEKLSKAFRFKEDKNVYQSEYSSELNLIQKRYPKRNPIALFDNYSDLGLALWFMDDAHFDGKEKRSRYVLSVKRIKDINHLLSIKNEFKSKVGVDCKVHKDGTLRFNNEEGLIIASKICRYVPDSMQYKLPDQFKGMYQEFELNHDVIFISANVNVKLLRFASDKQFRYKRKFDITVEHDENYMAGGMINGVVVHNSPTTTQGGHALKFYSDCRIEIARSSFVKSDEVSIGNLTKIKTIKNKTFSPFRTCEFNIVYGVGIDKTTEILELAIDMDIISKSGSWYGYGDTKLGQGAQAVVALLNDNEELLEELRTIIIQNLVK